MVLDNGFLEHVFSIYKQALTLTVERNVEKSAGALTGNTKYLSSDVKGTPRNPIQICLFITLILLLCYYLNDHNM